MHAHGPSCLPGPITRSRDWWSQTPPPKPPRRRPPRADGAIRTELVERVRREIAAGTYETPEKWAIALDRLWADLQSE
ncbi:MAG: flagellar biosynthesis anti-sigma factor FlgM [Gemmataceae bacterium]|nr:flagellar biosynthesis anti-sigma factor FlgM [Gemmataceae bacterium]MDW8267248.1 flagellar biosynthesis anti-sigma factor FlgM [Gemmataceae bacterium]